MIEKNSIQDIVEKEIEGTPMFLVDVIVRPGNIIVVEIDSDENIGIDDCIVLSKQIESKLDRDAEDFELEVGSAGLTSPLKIPRQYQKYQGKEVEVLTKDGKKHKGVLKSNDENGFTITVLSKMKPEGAKKKIDVEQDITFAYNEIKHTKYIISFK